PDPGGRQPGSPAPGSARPRFMIRKDPRSQGTRILRDHEKGREQAPEPGSVRLLETPPAERRPQPEPRPEPHPQSEPEPRPEPAPQSEPEPPARARAPAAPEPQPKQHLQLLVPQYLAGLMLRRFAFPARVLRAAWSWRRWSGVTTQPGSRGADWTQLAI